MRRKNEQAVAGDRYRRVDGRAMQLGSGNPLGGNGYMSGVSRREWLEGAQEDLVVPASTGMVSIPRYKTNTSFEVL